MAQHGKKYRDVAKLVDPHEGLPARRGGRPRAGRPSVVNFDPSVEAHIRLGVDPRHADQMVRGTVVLPARHRQGRPRRRLRPGREGPGGAARRRRRGRRRGPRQEDRGRLARVRRRGRDPRHDGHGRQARPDPRPPRPHAEPEGRHGHVRRRARHRRGEGRPRRVQGRQGRHPPRVRRQGELLRGGAGRQPRGAARRREPGQAVRGQGHLPARAVTIASTMGPGVRVDLPSLLAAAAA